MRVLTKKSQTAHPVDYKYSKFRHHSKQPDHLENHLVMLYKLFQYTCLWLIELTTTVVLVLAAFLLQRCSYLLYM